MAAYIAPHLRKKLELDANSDEAKEQTAKAQWELLSRSIGSIVNKINRANFQGICTEELFIPNLVRGRGLFCKDILHACLDSTHIAGAADLMPIYAALVAVVNSQLPNIGQMFCARTLDRYQRRVRIDADKTNAAKVLRLLCWLANFYVLDFVNIFDLIQTLIPSSIPEFVELVTTDSTTNLPKTLTLIQMCDLGLAAFQLCAQLIKSEDSATYQQLLDHFREIHQELDASINQKQQKHSSSTSKPYLIKLFFSLATLIEQSRDDFKLFSQFGDEIEEPVYDNRGRIVPPDPNIPPPQSLFIVPTEAQFSHEFDITDTKATADLCAANADWFKMDKDLELNEKRWEFIRDIIMGNRDPIPEEGFDLNDTAAQAIQLHQLDENSPYASAFSVHKLSDSLQLQDQSEAQKTVGFGGNTDIRKVEIDPEVEAVQITKSIYFILRQTATADESVHRLLKTLHTQYQTPAQRSKYIRHVALTIYDDMLAGGVYQKDHGAIGRLLCNKNRDFILEFEDLFALTCADIVNKKERETHILASFFGDLLSQRSISFLVFKYIDFKVSRESLHDAVAISTRVFLTSLLKQIRRNLGEEKLLQILISREFSNDTYSLFKFNTVKEYLAAAQFYRTAGLPRFETYVRHLQETDITLTTVNSGSSDDSSDDSTSSDDDSDSSNSSDSDDRGRRNRNNNNYRDRRRHSSPSSSASSSSSDSYSSRRRHDSSSSPSPPRRYRQHPHSSDSDSDHHNSSRRRSPRRSRPSSRLNDRPSNHRHSHSSSSSQSSRSNSPPSHRPYRSHHPRSDSGDDSDDQRYRNNRRSPSPSPPSPRRGDNQNVPVLSNNDITRINDMQNSMKNRDIFNALNDDEAPPSLEKYDDIPKLSRPRQHYGDTTTSGSDNDRDTKFKSRRRLNDYD